jgi:hypothetical protein
MYAGRVSTLSRSAETRLPKLTPVKVDTDGFSFFVDGEVWAVAFTAPGVIVGKSSDSEIRAFFGGHISDIITILESGRQRRWTLLST